MKNDFLYGVGTSASQIEGAYMADGKGLSMADLLPVNKNERFKCVKDGSLALANYDANKKYYPAHNAIDFFHTYKEDIELLAGLGINSFRLSIMWSRIFPTGEENEPNQEGLDFYVKVIDECLKNHLEPIVTISHFDTPVELIKKYGGWFNRKLIEAYLRLCEALFRTFQGKVHYWITFNEINMILQLPFVGGGLCFKTSENREQKMYQAAHYQLVASSAATKLAHQIDPKNKIGCMLAAGEVYPYSCNPQDVFAALQKNREQYFFSDIQVRGYYPSYADELFKQKNIKLDILPQDKEILKNTVDFVSLSYYSSRCTTTDPQVQKNVTDGNAFESVKNPYLDTSEWGWQIDPLGFRITLNNLYDRYQIPMMVVENGLGAVDTLTSDRKIHDSYRINYLKNHLNALQEARKDGVDLLGYMAWSGIDAISASTGEMRKRYGFIYVDYNDRGQGSGKRFKKDSYYWFKTWLAEER